MSNGASTGRGTTPLNHYESTAAWRDVDDYFTDLLVEEDEALVAARASGRRTTMPNAEVAANQGALLGMLVRIAGARRVLEFGTLAGYSTIRLARAVGPEGRVVTFELEEQNTEVARENLTRAGCADRVEVIVGSASDEAQRLIDERAEPFDFVFIDADKPSNPRYLAAARELTRAGAVIVIDNVVRDGAVVDSRSDDPRVQGVRGAAAAIAADPELEATAVQTVGVKGWDGLLIARRR